MLKYRISPCTQRFSKESPGRNGLFKISWRTIMAKSVSKLCGNFDSGRRFYRPTGTLAMGTMNRRNGMAVKGTNKNVKIGLIADRPYWFVYVSLISRAIHQLGAAVFLATYVLSPENVKAWQISLIVAAVSGFLLLGAEAIRHRQFLREVFGLSTIFKLVLVGFAHHGWLPAIPSVTAAFLLASLVSHAPKSVRHRLII